MANEVPWVRPAVISEKTYEALDDYLGFRHVVRNIYALHLEAERIENLVEDLQSVFALIRSELLAFANFIKQ